MNAMALIVQMHSAKIAVAALEQIVQGRTSHPGFSADVSSNHGKARCVVELRLRTKIPFVIPRFEGTSFCHAAGVTA